jgi:hypothetical protein
MSTPELPPEDKLARGLAEAKSSEVSTDPDPDTQREKADLEQKRYGTQTSGLTQDIAERKKYAGFFFGLSCAWLVAIMTIVMLQGFGSFWKQPFKLSDSIVLTMIGSTTVNVLGILYIVANYLFPKRGESDKAMES